MSWSLSGHSMQLGLGGEGPKEILFIVAHIRGNLNFEVWIIWAFDMPRALQNLVDSLWLIWLSDSHLSTY
jgi:hypothetical protein